MTELLLMDSGRYGWLALGAFYLIFEILIPILKKRAQAARQKQAMQPPLTPRPQAAAPVARRTAPGPSARPAQRKPVAAAARTSRTRQTHSDPVPIPAAPPSAILQLTNGAYEPFLKLPGIASVAQREGIPERIAAWTARPDFPGSFDLLHLDIMSTLLPAVPGLRPDAVASAGLEQGIGEIRSLEELAQASDRLAVGWLDTVFADAVGLTLVGAPYATRRIDRQMKEGRTHTLHLQNTGSRAMSVSAPLRILGPAYLAAVHALNLRADGVDLKRTLKDAGALDGQVRLELLGFGRPIHFDLDPAPAIEPTNRMFTGILQEKMPAFGGTTLAALSRTQDLSKMQEIAARERDKWIATGATDLGNGLARLMTLLLLAPQESNARLRLLASPDGHIERARAAAPTSVETTLKADPRSIVEAIVLGAILPRHGGRQP